MDALMYELAARQHSLVTRQQLLEIGFTDRKIDLRLLGGSLEAAHPGVYRIAGSQRSWEQSQLAALLAVGDEAVASHRAAAFLWGMAGPFRGYVELSAPLVRKARPRGAFTHRSTDLTADQITRRREIPVTNPLRTLVDLGAVVSQPVLDRAVDEALTRPLVSYEGLLTWLDRLGRRGRGGTAKLRASLAGRNGVPESVLEGEFQRLIHRYGLPEPVYQHEIRDDDGRFVGRVDAAYPELKIAIELDGASSRAGRDALEYDTERQNKIVDLGFLVKRYTWRPVVGTPQKTAAELLRTIERRRNELCLPTHT